MNVVLSLCAATPREHLLLTAFGGEVAAYALEALRGVLPDARIAGACCDERGLALLRAHGVEPRFDMDAADGEPAWMQCARAVAGPEERLVVSPLAGRVTPGRMRAMLAARQRRPGEALASTQRLADNSNPLWCRPLPGDAEWRAQFFEAGEVAAFQPEQWLSAEALEEFPTVKDFRGRQSLPDFHQVDGALVFVPRDMDIPAQGPWWFEPVLLKDADEETDMPLAYRLPILDMHEDVAFSGLEALAGASGGPA